MEAAVRPCGYIGWFLTLHPTHEAPEQPESSINHRSRSHDCEEAEQCDRLIRRRDIVSVRHQHCQTNTGQNEYQSLHHSFFVLLPGVVVQDRSHHFAFLRNKSFHLNSVVHPALNLTRSPEHACFVVLAIIGSKMVPLATNYCVAREYNENSGKNIHIFPGKKLTGGE